MIETLEPRSLRSAAPSAVLGADGTLTVTGTAQSDRIDVGIQTTLGFGSDNAITSETLTGYTVRLGKTSLGSFDATQVKKIVIDGLGGSDRITGAGLSSTETKSGPARTTDVERGAVVRRLADLAARTPNNVLNFARSAVLLNGQFAPTEINGGGGNDRIIGGLGNDTINGGTGNDSLIDRYGSNTINGNAGDDKIEVLEVDQLKKNRAFRLGDVVTGGAPDTVSGGAGRDYVLANNDDVVDDTFETRGLTYAVNANGDTTVKFNAPAADKDDDNVRRR